MTLFNPLAVQLRPERRTVGRSHRPWVSIACVSLLLFGGLAQRLAYLQLVQGSDFRDRAESNRVQTIPKPPGRGTVLDREGRVLAGSRISHSVALWRTALNSSTWPQTRRLLAEALDLDESEIQERADAIDYDSRFLVTVAQNVSPEKVTRLLEYGDDLPGLQIDLEASRYYPNAEVAAHVLGYTGEIDREELESEEFENSDRGYRYGDTVGKTGIERAFEGRLRGRPGQEKVQIDGKGRLLEVLGERPPEAGEDLTLTLDLDLQMAAEEVLGDRNGAVVALDPRNGEVLALASRPTFDPNIFTRRIDQATWEALQEKQHPFVNRALQGYPPASTFKVVTATAGMESGKVSPDAVLPTYAFLPVSGTQVWDWNRAGFGPMGFVRAMAWSSNTFFGQVALRSGPEALQTWARKYGFGQETGIELSREEAPGLIPNDAWKQETNGEPWHRVDTVNASIGQGYVQASPLQVAVMFAAVANGGYRVRPHLLRDPEAAGEPERESLGLQPKTLEVLQTALRSVVTGGTGQALNGAGLPPAAGKSGTAEDPPRESHAWFGGYAPYDKPEVVVVAFAENSGGGGGSVAGPMVRDVMAAYFRDRDRAAENASAEGDR